MIKMKSSCRQPSKKNWRFLLVLMAAMLSMAIVVLWLFSVRDPSHIVSFLGAGYALLCTAFFVAQLVAFVKAHTDYDQSIEQPKYDILSLEDEEWL